MACSGTDSVMPVKTDDEALNAYAKEVYDTLMENDIRVELDDRARSLAIVCVMVRFRRFLISGYRYEREG